METPPQQPLRIKPKIGKNALSCSVLAVAFILLLLSVFATVIAKTGIIVIPLFSRFYHGPMPTRVIRVMPQSVSDFRTELSAGLFSQIMSGAKPPYSVTVSEEDLSGVMQTVIQEGLKGQAWKETASQVVIRPADLEFTSRFQNGIWHIDLLVHFVPTVHDGGMSFVPVEARLGDYPIPVSAVAQIVSYLFSRDLSTFFLSFADTQLQAVRLGDGSLSVTATGHASIPTTQP